MWQNIIYYAIILKTAAIIRYTVIVKINANKIFLTNLYYFFKSLFSNPSFSCTIFSMFDHLNQIL